MQNGKEWTKNRFLCSMIVFVLLLFLSFLLILGSKLIGELHFENGGTITLAMAPLVLMSLLLGPVYGTLGGLLFGLFDLFVDQAFSIHWLSMLLDYFLAFGLVGVASVFSRSYFHKRPFSLLAATELFGALRYLCHFFSGIFLDFGGDNTSSLTPLDKITVSKVSYSAIYNMSYILPSFLMTSLVLIILCKPLFLLNRTTFIKTIAGKKMSDDGWKDDNDPSESFDLSLLNMNITISFFACLFYIPRFMMDFRKGLGFSVLTILLLASAAVVCVSLYAFMEDIINKTPYLDKKTLRYKLFHYNYRYDAFILFSSVVPLLLTVGDFVLFSTFKA